LTAVKEGRVLWVDESIFSRPGPRIVEAVEKLAAILYPERFGEGALQSSGNENASGAPGEPVVQATGARSSLSLETIYQRLVKPLVRLSVFIAIGLLIGNLIEGLQWTHHLGRLARPLLRWGHLSDHSAVAFMAAFFSGVTANTMLMNAYREEKLNRKELYFSSLVNTLPSFFLHLPTTFFILLPLVRMAGVLYLGVTLLATLVRTICLLMVSRYVLPRRDYDLPAHERSKLQKGEILQKTWKKFKKRFSKILLLTLPIYTLFFFLNHYGLFRWLEDQLAKLVSIRVIPIDALSVVVFQVMTEFAAGAAAAGALLDSGTLTVKTTVLALLIGNIISTPVRALRHQLPYYMGIYSPRLGLSLLLVNQSARVLSVFLMMLAFYWFYWG
jgi:hypothetical protein